MPRVREQLLKIEGVSVVAEGVRVVAEPGGAAS